MDCDRCALVGCSAGSSYAQGTELDCLQLEKEYVQIFIVYLMGEHSLKLSASLTSSSRVIFLYPTDSFQDGSSCPQTT